MEILFPGVIRFPGAIAAQTNGLSSSLLSRAEQQRTIEYPVIADTYAINRSGHRIPVENLNKTCIRFSDFTNKELLVIETFETTFDSLLLRYCAEYPMSIPCLWWKTEGHVLLYKAGAELGLHADIDVNYQPGNVPDYQLGTKHVLAAITYFGVSSDGGDLLFPYLNIRIKPQNGDVIFFPSHFIYAHKVEAIVAGHRFAYLTYFGQGTDDGRVPVQIRESLTDVHGGQVWINWLPDRYAEYLSSTFGKEADERLLPLTRATTSTGTFDELSRICQ